LPGSYPGDAGSNPAPATNPRSSLAGLGLGMSPLPAFLLGLTLGLLALPAGVLLAMYRRWRLEGEGSPADAATFQTAFKPKDRG
jgi:hypothetical protein